MKTDVNKENDALLRKGLSALHVREKEKAARKEKLDEPGVKEDLMKFIFGQSDYNPLKDGKKNEK